MSEEVTDATAPPGAESQSASEAAAAPSNEVFEPKTALSGASLDAIIDVPLRVTVEVGGARMLVREVLQLNRGSVVPLDRQSGDPADILVNGRLIARGEVTVVEDALAVRVVELIGRDAGAGGR